LTGSVTSRSGGSTAVAAVNDVAVASAVVEVGIGVEGFDVAVEVLGVEETELWTVSLVPQLLSSNTTTTVSVHDVRIEPPPLNSLAPEPIV
jgi:hypothetical protein